MEPNLILEERLYDKVIRGMKLIKWCPHLNAYDYGVWA